MVRVANPDGFRGWHVVCWVKYPGARKTKRIYVTWAPGIGQIETEAEARRVRDRIIAQAQQRTIQEVLAEYKRYDVPENTVLARWNAEVLPYVNHQHAYGRISKGRLLAFERMERCGYLDFWRDVSIFSLDEPKGHRWLQWIEATYPKMTPVSRRHIIRDFWTGLRHLKRLGVLKEVPPPPRVQIPETDRSVPNRPSVWRILEAIPEERRGLFLSRSLAGLRVTESRRLNVSHYKDGTIRIPANIAKTRKSRALLVCPRAE